MAMRRSRTRKEAMQTSAAIKAIRSLAYGSDRTYISLPYHDRRFGSCNYSKMDFDTDPLGSRQQMQGRLETVPNISFQGHHAWNSKESDWWRDALRKEERSKQDNLRGLNCMAMESKKVHPIETEPRTVLNTHKPVMGEASLKKLRQFNSHQTVDILAGEKKGRAASADPAGQWEGHMLAKFGLEFGDDHKQRIVPAGTNRRIPSVREIQELQMSTIVPGAHSPRFRNAFKKSRSFGGSHSGSRKIDIGKFVDKRLV